MADRVDQILALGAIDEQEGVEDAVFERLADVDLRLGGVADRDQHFAVGAGHVLQLGEVGSLPLGVGDADALAAPGVEERFRQALPVGVVDVEHADVGVALIGRQLGQHGALRGVGDGAAEEEAVVVGEGDLRRGGRGGDGRDVGRAGDGLGDGEGDAAGERTDDRVRALDLDQPARLLDGARRVEPGVAGDDLHILPEDAAGVVEVLDRQPHAGLNGGAELGDRAGVVGQEGDLERVAGRRGRLFVLARRGLRGLILLLGGGLLGDLLLLLLVIAAASGDQAGGQRKQRGQRGRAEPQPPRRASNRS